MAPIIKPFLLKLERPVKRWRQVTCANPSIILEYITHECHDLDRWIPAGKRILRTNKWVKSELWERVVPLHKIGAPLIANGYWQVEDAKFFEDKRVEIVGPNGRVKRMALILWGIQEGILKATGSSGGTQDGAAASGSRAVDRRLQNPVKASRVGMAVFHHNVPEAGVPIATSKVIVPMVIDIRQRPTPTFLVSERVVRDLGTLIHDPRGAFEVEVECTLSHSLREIVGRMDGDLLPGHQYFERVLMGLVETRVHDFTCFTADKGYKRPIRPPAWPIVQELCSPFTPTSGYWFHHKKDGDKSRGVVPLGSTLGNISVTTKEDFEPEIMSWVEACKLLGCPVQYEEHEFGLIWITKPNNVAVILGEAELPDA